MYRGGERGSEGESEGERGSARAGLTSRSGQVIQYAYYALDKLRGTSFDWFQPFDHIQLFDHIHPLIIKYNLSSYF